jgi:hypothetical protein
MALPQRRRNLGNQIDGCQQHERGLRTFLP